MKIKNPFLVLISVVLYLVTACVNGIESQEQKIEVQKRHGENKYEDYKEITDKEQIQNVKIIFEKANWENAKVNMVRRADYRFLFQYKNPEIEAKAVLYELWISPNKDKVEVVKGDNEYVLLSEGDSAVLFEILTGEKWNLSAFTLTACEEEQVDKDNGKVNQGNIEKGQIQGYIVFHKESDITILIRDENFNIQDMNLPLKELQVNYNDIMLLIVDESPKNIKSGQKVKLGFCKILESDPPKVVVTKIVKIDD